MSWKSARRLRSRASSMTRPCAASPKCPAISNPLHMDEEYAARTPFRGRIAHGALIASYISCVLGNHLPGPGAVFAGMTMRFERPVRIGDTVIGPRHGDKYRHQAAPRHAGMRVRGEWRGLHEGRCRGDGTQAPREFGMSGVAAGNRQYGGVAALGNFDGVHAGHRTVLDLARKLAGRISADPVAAVCSARIRASFFRPDDPPFRLMSDGQRARALREAGMARVETIRFDGRLSSMSPEDFVRDVLVGQLGVEGVVTGADFCFGKGRAGNAATLETLGAQYGFAVAIAPSLGSDRLQAGVKISSSAVREAIREGDMERAGLFAGTPLGDRGRGQPW